MMRKGKEMQAYTCVTMLAAMIILLSTKTFAMEFCVDETPAFINALTHYVDNNTLSEAGLRSMLDGFARNERINPIDATAAGSDGHALAARDTLEDYLQSASLDPSKIRSWATEKLKRNAEHQSERDYATQKTRAPSEVASISLSAGMNHTCAITANGKVTCWGNNSYGQTNVPPDLGEVQSISVGGAHTCAIKADSTLSCWGANSNGQSKVPSGLGTVWSVSAAEVHTCATKADNSLACWGGDAEWRSDIPYSPSIVRSISTGRSFTCVIYANGALTCAQNNEYRKVFTLTGPFKSVSASSHICDVDADGNLSCWGFNGHGQTNIPRHLGTVRSVSTGAYHTCAIKTDDTIACFGDNSHGQSSVPPRLGRVLSISAGYWHTCAVKTDKTVVCFGDDVDGQTRVPEGLIVRSSEVPSTIETWWDTVKSWLGKIWH